MTIDIESDDEVNSERPTRRVGKRKPAAAAKLEVASPVAETSTSPEANPEFEARTAKGAQPISRLFLQCLSIGFALALLGIAKTPITHWIGVLGPIGATAAYPLVGSRRGFHKSPSQRERFADNCYYLGFIFTQVGLLVSFLPVVLVNQAIGSQDVIRAFSMALGAALVGLVARTYFIQTGLSVSENSQRIEDEVEALAVSVSKQAKSVLGQFDAIGKRLTTTYTKLDGELEASVGSLVRTLGRYEEALNRDARNIEAGTAAVTDAAAETLTSVAGEQQKFVAGLQEAVRGVREIQTAATAQLSSATATLKASTEALAQGAEAISGASNLRDRLDGFEVRIESAGKAALGLQAELTTTAERLTNASAEALTALEGVGEGLAGRAADRAQEFEKELSEAVRLLEQTLSSFRAELERVRV